MNLSDDQELCSDNYYNCLTKNLNTKNGSIEMVCSCLKEHYFTQDALCFCLATIPTSICDCS
ncbi:MAG: hypothetical protein FJZ56_01640 [Chlamydiae bacterium]|nr:hypothetical protein [Chlamydiota bacterium]